MLYFERFHADGVNWALCVKVTGSMFLEIRTWRRCERKKRSTRDGEGLGWLVACYRLVTEIRGFRTSQFISAPKEITEWRRTTIVNESCWLTEASLCKYSDVYTEWCILTFELSHAVAVKWCEAYTNYGVLTSEKRMMSTYMLSTSVVGNKRWQAHAQVGLSLIHSLVSGIRQLYSATR